MRSQHWPRGASRGSQWPQAPTHADAAAQTLSSLIGDTPLVDVTFTAVGHEQAYFRALYLAAEPCTQLTTLHEAARRTLAPEPWHFTPHLSLLYSDISEAPKHAIIDNTLPLTARFDAVELWARSDPEVRGWYRVARVALAGLSQRKAR